MTTSINRRGTSRGTARLVAIALSLACAPRQVPTLAPLCSGSPANAHLAATIDTIRPTAGAELTAAKGSRFELTIVFAAPTTRADGSSCTGTTGTATFTGTLPERLRTATAPAGRASWRIDGDTVLLDLNPGTRDNNVFVSLPLTGGRGHWGLSTFAGEVGAGEMTFLP
jgi:hypothetical protein